MPAVTSARPEPRPRPPRARSRITLPRTESRPPGRRSRGALAALLLGLVLGLAAPGAGAQTAAQGFLGGVEDLPLMAGLSEVPEARVVFDKPGGRIVEAFAVGKVRAAEVAAFYGAALPQLGWTRVGAGAFEREGEILAIDVADHDSGVTVRFSISPQ